MSTSNTDNNTADRAALFRAYLKERKGLHPLAPRTAHEALRTARCTVQPANLGLDLDLQSSRRRDVIFESAIDLDPAKVEALGFTPGKLAARVSLFHDDVNDSIEDIANNMGYDLDKFERDYTHSKASNRPDASSVEVDLGGYRRTEKRWITLRETDAHYFYGAAMKGAARGVKAEVLRAVRQAASARQGRYLTQLVDGDVGPYCVVVEVLWNNEVVGGASLGGVEIESKYDETVADVILGHGMLDEALDEAVKWADKAHDKLPPRAKKCAAT